MGDFVDQPVEVTLTDGSRWIIYYRSATSYARAIPLVHQDIIGGQLLPAADLDGVQRRFAQINAAQIVSVREVEEPSDG